MPKASTVDEYIAIAPEHAKEKLMEIRSILKKVSPEAKQRIKWGVPIMETHRILYSFSAYKHHMNFMPTGPTLALFRDQLSDFKMGKDTIQFEYDKPLPVDIIEKMARHRYHDVMANDAKWMY